MQSWVDSEEKRQQSPGSRGYLVNTTMEGTIVSKPNQEFEVGVSMIRRCKIQLVGHTEQTSSFHITTLRSIKG